LAGPATGRWSDEYAFHYDVILPTAATDENRIRAKRRASVAQALVIVRRRLKLNYTMAASSAPVPNDVHGKALSLNLDASIYGTLAEIGAGQEVARWFLTVGAASGTVAKTISAYDKTVSDDIYGTGTRYVSKERLIAMLDREYKLLLDRLQPTRGKDTRFFVFADTVATAITRAPTSNTDGWVSASNPSPASNRASCCSTSISAIRVRNYNNRPSEFSV
jgi:hypothetical protein